MKPQFDGTPLDQLYLTSGKYKVVKGAELSGLLEPLHGLWRFALPIGRGTRHFDVRLDAEDGLASGDVFFDAGRREWDRSFRSTTAYLRDNGSARYLVLNCDAALDGRRPGAGEIARLMLRIQFEKDEIEAAEARAIRFGKTWRTEWAGELTPDANGNGEWPFTFSPGTFRQIGIDYFFDDLLSKDDQARAHRVMTDLVPGFLEAEGIAVRARHKAPEKFGTQFADIAGPLADTQSSKEPWAFSLVFSGVSEETQKKRGKSRDVPFGRAVGLDGLPGRYRNRFGAIVFAGELERDFEEAERETAGIFQDNRDMRMAFAVMHELGHLLNLPHPWERDLAIRADNVPEPASRTWMAYGSYYPFGAIAAQAYQGDNSAVARRRRRRAHQKFLQLFNEDPGYSPAEREHLRHASFDQIAVGKRTFTDSLRPSPVITKGLKSREFELELKIIDGTDNKPLCFSTAAPAGFAHEPPSGSLTLETKSRPTEPLQFEFHTGAVQILVQGVPADRDPAEPPPNYAVRVYNPLVHAENGLDWGRDYDDFLGPKPGAKAYELAFPLIPPGFWVGFDRQLAFRIQAIFYAPDGVAVRSDIAEVRYARIDSDAYMNNLKDQVDELKALGLPAWRKHWFDAQVGLANLPSASPGSAAAADPNLARWADKWGGTI